LPILFSVDARSGVPIYQQLVDQVRLAVALGAVRPGEQLPTVKSVAAELTVNANTVLRAYRDLEQAGIVASTQGRGTFVRENGTPQAASTAIRELAAEGLDAAVRQARSLGVEAGDLRVLIEAALDRWYGTAPATPEEGS
jgi:GntR family transcriptional regulator